MVMKTQRSTRCVGSRGSQLALAVTLALVTPTFIALRLTVPTLAQGAATGSVDFGTNLQRIDGFGIAEPWRSNIIRGALGLTPEHQQEVLDLFFSRERGAGLSIPRLGVETDSSIQPTDPGGPTATPHYVWDGQDGGQVWLAKEAQARRVR